MFADIFAIKKVCQIDVLGEKMSINVDVANKKVMRIFFYEISVFM